MTHIDLANHNESLLDVLWPQVAEFPDWVATVAFSKALHVVEAVFANDPAIGHGKDHNNRERALKTSNRYTKIYSHYRPLYAASLIARYASDAYASFLAYMPLPKIESTLIGHHLHQLESSACRFLKHPDVLRRINTPPTPPVDPAGHSRP